MELAGRGGRHVVKAPTNAFRDMYRECLMYRPLRYLEQRIPILDGLGFGFCLSHSLTQLLTWTSAKMTEGPGERKKVRRGDGDGVTPSALVTPQDMQLV